MSDSAEITLEQGTIIRGKRLTYVVDEDLGDNRYEVLTPQYGRTVMRVEKIAEIDRLQRLNNELALLTAAECAPPEHRAHLTRLYDFGVTADFKYMTVSRIGLSLEDVLYQFGVPFGHRTIRHIAGETLAALREVHELGYLVRNVRPDVFNIGPSPFGERSIYLGSYDRVFNYMGANNKPKRPRPCVAWPYAPLYASRARLSEHDCTISDDYESWLYMLFDLYDQHGWIRDDPELPREDRSLELLRQKEAIMTGDYPDHFFEKIPEVLKDAVEAVAACKWARVPDKDRIDAAVRGLLPCERGSSWWRLDWEGQLPIDMQTAVMRPPTIAPSCNLLAHFPDISDPLCKQRWDTGTTGNEVSKRKPVTISNSPDNTSKREKQAATQEKEHFTKTKDDNLIPTEAEGSKNMPPEKKTSGEDERKTTVEVGGDDRKSTEAESGGLYGEERTCSPKAGAGSFSPNGTQNVTPAGAPAEEGGAGGGGQVLRGFDEHGNRVEMHRSSPEETEENKQTE